MHSLYRNTVASSLQFNIAAIINTNAMLLYIVAYSQGPLIQDSLVIVPFGTNATIEFQVCRRNDHHTNYSVIVGIAKGVDNEAFPIFNNHINYPLYTSKNITIIYNKKWRVTNFCKGATVYIDGRIVTNETTIHIRLHSNKNISFLTVDKITVIIVRQGNNYYKHCHLLFTKRFLSA